MTIMSFIFFLVIGGLAGFAAAKIMRGHGLGIIGNVLVGIVGAFIGGLLFSLIGLRSYSLVGSFVTATIGAIILLAIVGWLSKSDRSVRV
jgi:uncharacterized membrane protein YeaQ/YmgE (transglycosylase-associated protein family)